MASKLEKIRPRRHWFSFSLGSLLLFVLLIGFTATAWWRWDAWVLMHSFRGVGIDTPRGPTFLANRGKVMVQLPTGWHSATVFNAVTGMNTDEGGIGTISPDLRWGLKKDYETRKLLLTEFGAKTVPLADLAEAEPSGRFSPDSRLVMIVMDNNAIRVVNLQNGKNVFTSNEQDSGFCDYGFMPDSARTFALGEDGILRCWDLASGQLRGRLRGRRFHVQQVFISQDSRLLLAACSDACARLYSLPELEFQIRLGWTNLDDYLYTAAFSGDMNLIATSTWGGTVKIWSLRTGDELMQLRTSGVRANALAFSPDGKRLLIGGADGATRLWDTSGRQVLHLPGAVESYSFEPPHAPMPELETASDKDEESVGGNEAPETSAEIAWRATEDAFGDHKDQICEVRYVADGNMIMTGCVDNTIGLWDSDTGERIRPAAKGNLIAVTPDCLHVAMGNPDAKTVEVWECRRKHGENRLATQPELLFGGVILLLILLNAYRALKGGRSENDAN